MIYYNTKTSATIEMSAENFKKLPDNIRKKYRKASTSEEKLHKKRADQKKVADSRREKAQAAKAKKGAKDSKKADAAKEGADASK